MNEVDKTVREQGYDTAFQKVINKIQEYPTCNHLSRTFSSLWYFCIFLFSISNLDTVDCEKLISSIRTIKKYFSRATKNINIRPYREEDVSYVIDRQLSLYESERHFTTEVWKKYLTQGVISLVEKFDSQKDCMFILECDKSPAGCVAITHTKENVAQLRYFFLEPELRGLGVGTDLLHKALDFCHEKKYSHVFLWTVSAQETARKLYKKVGFEITEASENENWGVPVLEEKWDLDLT